MAAAVVWVWGAALLLSESATMRLSVEVEPEVRIEPEQIPLRFLVSPGGRADGTTQSTEITAWIRPAPGQPIRLMAHLMHLEGPGGGMVSPSILRWAGAKTRATGGGQQAQCSSGSFASGSDADLIRGWERSGSVSCSMRFELDQKVPLPPGEYRGLVTVVLGRP